MRPANLVIAMMAAVFCAAGCATADYKVARAETTGKGEYILYKWEVCGQKHYRVLTQDYGMMIFYDASAKDARPLFVLHDRKTRVVVRTTNLDRFKKLLQEIPAGQTLHFYNTCCGGTYYGLGASVIGKIRDCCREADIRLDDGPLHIICTCL